MQRNSIVVVDFLRLDSEPYEAVLAVPGALGDLLLRSDQLDHVAVWVVDDGQKDALGKPFGQGDWAFGQQFDFVFFASLDGRGRVVDPDR